MGNWVKIFNILTFFSLAACGRYGTEQDRLQVKPLSSPTSSSEESKEPERPSSPSFPPSKTIHVDLKGLFQEAPQFSLIQVEKRWVTTFIAKIKINERPGGLGQLHLQDAQKVKVLSPDRGKCEIENSLFTLSPDNGELKLLLTGSDPKWGARACHHFLSQAKKGVEIRFYEVPSGDVGTIDFVTLFISAK